MRNFLRFFLLAALFSGLLLQPPTAHASVHTGAYDPQAEGVVSGYLCIQDGYITGIAPGTTLADLNSRSLPGDLTASAELLATGTLLTSQAAGQQLMAVFTGDLNGDGEVTISDMLMVKSHLLGAGLEKLAALAGDVNYDGEVSISDFLNIKAYLLGKSDIAFQAADTREPLILLALGQTQSWTGAVSYRSDNAAVAQIDETGSITATGLGTTFLYGLDGNGTVIARTAVTVLDEGLSVTLDKDTYALYPNQQLQVGTKLNHPLPAALTWETQDGAICSVDENGLLTGHTFGDTVLRAKLPGGGYAEAAVRVMSPITQMDFETQLYKLKPGTTRPARLNILPLDTGDEILWTTSDPAIATVSDAGVLSGHNYGTVTVTATGKYSGRTASCTVKVCDLKQVAITFDDGPSKYTPQLLDWLKENGIKATFFVVGNRLSSYKSTLKRIVDEGHELGYHSYSHSQQTDLSTQTIISDFETTNQMAINITGKGFTLWRTPGGGYNQRVLDAVPLPHILWAVDTRDWESRDTQSVYRMILSCSDDGEIILLHDLYKTSVEGAIQAMEEMIAGDYEFLTVTELLSRNGTPPRPHASYSRAS